MGTKQNSPMPRTGQFRTVNPKAQQKKKALLWEEVERRGGRLSVSKTPQLSFSQSDSFSMGSSVLLVDQVVYMQNFVFFNFDNWGGVGFFHSAIFIFFVSKSILYDK